MLTGTMAPGANCPLVVRFCPKALGQHQASLSVQVLSEATDKVLAQVPFKALGLCRQLGGPRGPLPGGPMALPESFAKPKQFVDPDKVRVNPSLAFACLMYLVHSCLTYPFQALFLLTAALPGHPETSNASLDCGIPPGFGTFPDAHLNSV